MPISTSHIEMPSVPACTILNGKYNTLATLGEGAQGHVVLAKDLVTNRDVAVKICPTADKNCETESVFFSCGLVHKNLLQALEQFEENDSTHFVLEYVKSDLFDVLKDADCLSMSQLRLVIKLVLQGLLEMHQNGYAHRDIKPENILVGSENIDSCCEIKLADFGFVHNIKEKPFADTFCGSEAYVAPELFLFESYDPLAADVWSVGIVMYNAFTSISPWDAATDEEAVFNCYKRCPANFWEWTDNYSPQKTSALFRSLFESMCAIEPMNRLTVEQCLEHPFFADA